jgi:hypothetical protein
LLVVSGGHHVACRVVEMAQLVIGERSVLRLFCTDARMLLLTAAEREAVGVSGRSGTACVNKEDAAQDLLVRFETSSVTTLSAPIECGDRYEYRYVW